METATNSIVSRANISASVDSDLPNYLQLKRIDASITAALTAVVGLERRDRNHSARIITAGVRMLSILKEDWDAWEQFKRSNPKAKDIRCKGTNWETREIANVIWRRHQSTGFSRERRTMYGKAIGIAHRSYWESGIATTQEKLLEHITNAGGVKGLIKMNKTPKGNLGRKKIVLDIPDKLKLVLLYPDGIYEHIEDDQAHSFLLQIGLLQ
jgi:hypothetical protein